MTFGSLFAGIGGFDLGLERAGMECRWQVEIDPWARRVLAKHWPGVPKFGDIRELTGEQLGPVDLICGGFPCQPYSVAGKQLGDRDERALWPEMRRLVSVLKPRWVVGENVPGLLRLGHEHVCADLEAYGYEVWTLCIPACAVGAPHVRERVWIVAYSERGRRGPERLRGMGDALGGGRDGADLPPAIEDPSACESPSHAASLRRRTRRERRPLGVGTGLCDTAGALADPDRAGREEQHAPSQPGRSRRPGWNTASGRRHWAVEPPVGRVADGIPGRVDRLRGLGNAVVPQIPELLGRWIMDAEQALCPSPAR